MAATGGVHYVQPPKVPILTAQGTGLGMWDQIPPQPAYIANYAPPELAIWQPLGNYPASIFNPPMGVSAQMLADEFVRILTEVYHGVFAVEVYSQSAVAWSHVWRDEILSKNGKLYGRASDMLFTIALGNPCRCPGVANGNAWAGWPMPGKIDGVTTGGIAGADDLKPNEVPANFYDFVNTTGPGAGSSALYEMAPVGDNPWSALVPVGVVENSIYKAVMEQSFGSILAIAEDLMQPIGVVEGIINGFKFLGAGAAADHYTYPTEGPIALQNWCLANYAATYA